jgi:hypothetical protein
MLFCVHLGISVQRMCRRSFDLWACSFLWEDENADDDHDSLLLFPLIVELDGALAVAETSYVATTLVAAAVAAVEGGN